MIVAAALAAACASNSPPPAASATSIDQASSTPSSNPDFAPAANDGSASAASDVYSDTPAHTPAHTPVHQAVTPSAAPPAQPQHADAAREVPVSNAAASPAQAPAAVAAPDNSRVNARDTGGKTLTPMDQGGSESDRKLTQQIRQAVMKDGSLSFTAKNVKIITINGKVTLRGPVKTDAERSAIEAAAKSAAGANQVDSQLEVKK